MSYLGTFYGYTQKKLHNILRWVFIGKFSEQAKVPRFRVVFRLANFLLSNKCVSIQVILFSLNHVLRASLTFFGMESKISTQTLLILLILTLYDC